MLSSPQTMTSEDRFQLFLDAASDYAIFFTDERGTITEWSSSAEKIIGYTEAEALGMISDIIFTREDREAGAPQQERATAAREGQADDERWHVKKDGSRFFGIGRLVALKDGAGHLLGYAKILRDATPHKHLEQALHTSDEQFRATFAQAPLGMALTDLQGQIQQVNDAFCRLTGFPAPALEQRDIVSLSAPEDRPRVAEHVRELLGGERPYAIVEKRLQRADGSIVWVQNSAALLRASDGRPLSFIDLCQDISVLKLSAEELERAIGQRTAALETKTKQMEAFCYTVAHDLRAPLRTISGYAEFLRMDFGTTLPEEAVDYVRKIESAAARLDRLISDLLGYTRMQQVPLIREEVDLDALTGRVIEQVTRDWRRENPEIEMVSPLGKVRADATTLEHVLLNLLSNAVKFHRPEVPPMVRIRATLLEERLRIWVEDNGVGIDPRFKDRVFGMFERLHPELTVPGTGVGLAIVATAMERLGGTCGVEPNSPFGSRFWLEFPK